MYIICSFIYVLFVSIRIIKMENAVDTEGYNNTLFYVSFLSIFLTLIPVFLKWKLLLSYKTFIFVGITILLSIISYTIYIKLLEIIDSHLMIIYEKNNIKNI